MHEAYLRLVDVDQSQQWNSRGHFFGAAAEAMRRIIVENARIKLQIKRGGEYQRVPMEMIEPAFEDRHIDYIALDEALTQLETEKPRAAQIVKLRYFAGLTSQDAADALGISKRTADREFETARLRLLKKLTESNGEQSNDSDKEP